jgi:hypothetical protein
VDAEEQQRGHTEAIVPGAHDRCHRRPRGIA